MMLVANHVSWLDIFVIQAVCPSRFVSKSEVRSWPVPWLPILGWLCEKAGTLFIARSTRADVKRINEEMIDLLKSGEVVAVFPEGMTTEGGRVAPFHASLLHAALISDAHVRPVGIRYMRPDGSASAEVIYAGDTRFFESVRAIANQARTVAQLIFTETIATAGLNRSELARQARDQIIAALGFSTASANATDGSQLETPGDLRAEPPRASLPTGSHYQAPADSSGCEVREPTSGRKRSW